MKRSNTYLHAQKELDILLKIEDSVIKPFYNQILELCDSFGKSGQSGGSAPYTATAISKVIKKLCLQEPISPITGIEEEWNDVSGYGCGESFYQNKRCSALFKIYKDGPAYYIDAIVFKDQNGSCFTNCGYGVEGISSAQNIKSFPFTPKTFYIDVISVETKPGWWENSIKDETQLNKVFEYYDKKQ